MNNQELDKIIEKLNDRISRHSELAREFALAYVENNSEECLKNAYIKYGTWKGAVDMMDCLRRFIYKQRDEC